MILYIIQLLEWRNDLTNVTWKAVFTAQQLPEAFLCLLRRVFTSTTKLSDDSWCFSSDSAHPRAWTSSQPWLQIISITIPAGIHPQYPTAWTHQRIIETHIVPTPIKRIQTRALVHTLLMERALIYSSKLDAGELWHACLVIQEIRTRLWI